LWIEKLPFDTAKLIALMEKAASIIIMKMQMMKISVSLHGTLRKKRQDLADRDPVTTKAATVGQLLDEIDIPKRQAAIVFVNEKRASLEFALQDGDTVKIFPMLGGG